MTTAIATLITRAPRRIGDLRPQPDAKKVGQYDDEHQPDDEDDADNGGE